MWFGSWNWNQDKTVRLNVIMRDLERWNFWFDDRYFVFQIGFRLSAIANCTDIKVELVVLEEESRVSAPHLVTVTWSNQYFDALKSRPFDRQPIIRFDLVERPPTIVFPEELDFRWKTNSVCVQLTTIPVDCKCIRCRHDSPPSV